MALEAVVQVLKDSDQAWMAFEWRDVEFLAGLTVPDDEEGVEVGIRLIDLGNSSNRLDSGFEFLIHTHHSKGVTRICRGTIQPIVAEKAAARLDHVQESEAGERIAAAEAAKALRRSTKCTKGSTLYTRLYKLGYQFGDSFRRIEHVHWEDVGEAVGKVSVFDDPSATPTVIHPATLDGVIQFMLPATTSAGNVKTPIMIPTRIDRLWVARDGLLPASSSQLQTHTTLRSTSLRTKEFNSSTFDLANGSLKVQFEGIQATAIAALDDPLSTQGLARQLCFDIDYKPDISLLYTDRLQEILDLHKPASPEPVDLWLDIRELVWALMRRIADELDEAHVPSHLPHLRNHLNWIKQRCDHIPESTTAIADLYRKVERHGRIGQIYINFADRMHDILVGQVDALEHLAQDNILRDYYDFNNKTSKFFGPLGFFLQLLSHKNPALKIMEVGAGTGSTTQRLMDVLATRTSYGYSAQYSRFDFTDISPAFLNVAREDFGMYPKTHFCLFDVEKEASEQGYEGHSYDVIVAANVGP